MSADLELRLQRLEDVEAIRNLKHAYCYACDDDYNVEQLKNSLPLTPYGKPKALAAILALMQSANFLPVCPIVS